MIGTATEENRSAVECLLPDRLADELAQADTLCLFDTDASGLPVSVLLAKAAEERFELLWLFTAEESRKEGRATALLARLQTLARQIGVVESIAAALPTDSEVLAFLLEKGFAVSTALDVEYRAPVGELLKESLWRTQCPTEDIVPLDEISSPMLDVFGQAVLQQGNPAGLPLPLKWADYLHETSFAALSGGRMSAVLLAEKDDGCVSLSALHAVTGGGDTVRQLLYAAGMAAIKTYPPETEFRFIAVNPVSRRLASKLLRHADRRYICRLSLPVEPAVEESK